MYAYQEDDPVIAYCVGYVRLAPQCPAFACNNNTETSAPDSTLEWGSLRLAPINTTLNICINAL